MSDPLLASIRTDLDRLEPRARAAVQGLSPQALAQAPPDGGWSIAQVFEHLCVADRSYLDGPLPAAIARARARAGGAAPRPHRPSLLGGWLRRALARTDNKLPAPGIYRVGPQVRAGVVDQWADGLRRLRALLDEARGLDLRTRMSSPVSRLIRINLGDALAIPVVHAERHLRQIERIRAALGT